MTVNVTHAAVVDVFVHGVGVPAGAAPEGKRVTWGAPSPGDWPTYNGTLDANRYSPHKQINTANISRLRLQWIFPIPHFGLEVTPLEAGGVMYVTGPNQVFAIDAIAGTQLWKYSRPPTAGLDPNQIRQVRDLIRSMAGDKTIMLSTQWTIS